MKSKRKTTGKRVAKAAEGYRTPKRYRAKLVKWQRQETDWADVLPSRDIEQEVLDIIDSES